MNKARGHVNELVQDHPLDVQSSFRALEQLLNVTKKLSDGDLFDVIADKFGNCRGVET